MKIIPEIGNTVDVHFIGGVVSVLTRPEGTFLDVELNIGEGKKRSVLLVPNHCAQVFDPNREAELININSYKY